MEPRAIGHSDSLRNLSKGIDAKDVCSTHLSVCLCCYSPASTCWHHERLFRSSCRSHRRTATLAAPLLCVLHLFRNCRRLVISDEQQLLDLVQHNAGTDDGWRDVRHAVCQAIRLLLTTPRHRHRLTTLRRRHRHEAANTLGVLAARFCVGWTFSIWETRCRQGMLPAWRCAGPANALLISKKRRQIARSPVRWMPAIPHPPCITATAAKFASGKDCASPVTGLEFLTRCPSTSFLAW